MSLYTVFAVLYAFTAHGSTLLLLCLPLFISLHDGYEVLVPLCTSFLIITFAHATRYFLSHTKLFLQIHMLEYLVSSCAVAYQIPFLHPLFANPNPFAVIFFPLIFIIWVIFIEWTFFMALSAGYDDAGAYAEFHEMFQGAVKGVWVFVLRMVFKGSGWALRVSTSGGNGEPGLRIQGVEASLPPPYSAATMDGICSDSKIKNDTTATPKHDT